jgi:hypothetical protein
MIEPTATFGVADCAEILKVAVFGDSQQDQRIRAVLQATQPQAPGSILIALTTDKRGATVFATPAGTAKVHWASMPSMVSSGAEVRYVDLPVGQTFAPTSGPVVDALALDVNNNPLGGWAGRIQTVPWAQSFTAGLVLNADLESDTTLGAVSIAGAKLVRVEFSIDAGPEGLERLQAKLPGVIIQPLIGFPGRLPSPVEMNLNRFAVPGVHLVEFGNETNYQIPCTFTNGKSYGERAAEAIKALQPKGVGLLVQGSDAGTRSIEWLSGVFAGLNGLLPAGWTIHPYPGGVDAQAADGWGLPMMERLIAGLEAHGDKTVPIYATEWGIPTDNGRTLSDGKHYTFAEAALMTTQHVGALRSAAKGRLAQLVVYCGHDLATTGLTTDREEYFGVTTIAGGRKGAYTPAVTALLAG